MMTMIMINSCGYVLMGLAQMIGHFACTRCDLSSNPEFSHW